MLQHLAPSRQAQHHLAQDLAQPLGARRRTLVRHHHLAGIGIGGLGRGERRQQRQQAQQQPGQRALYGAGCPGRMGYWGA